jgi:hypothetical protein
MIHTIIQYAVQIYGWAGITATLLIILYLMYTQLCVVHAAACEVYATYRATKLVEGKLSRGLWWRIPYALIRLSWENKLTDPYTNSRTTFENEDGSRWITYHHPENLWSLGELGELKKRKKNG